MHKLLYYPNFEIQDENFLKFALLYIDEIRPIIPDRARNLLSDTMQDILRDTNLFDPYTPDYRNGQLACIAAIQYLEDRKYISRYDPNVQESNNPYTKHNYILYAEKYTDEFENYCLQEALGKRCNEGILLDEDVAYAYMSILAEIISKETETDMITDNRKYADSVLIYPSRFNRRGKDRLGTIQREIQFHVPYDMYRIPLGEFIRLRSDPRFEELRKNFVAEINTALDAYDKDVSEVDLRGLMGCKQEIYGILKKLFTSCAAVAVGVHSFGNMISADKGTLDFWGNAGNVGISLGSLKHEYIEIREYISRIERNRKARKYLAKLKQLRAEIW